MTNDFSFFAGRWIAVIGGRVVGQGGTPEQAAQAAATTRYKETPKVFYVPTQIQLTFPHLLYQVNDVLPSKVNKYLVGGAIRDALLNRPIHDFDIIVDKDSLKFARKVADQLGGVYFQLDEKRGTARVILKDSDGSLTTFDFATIQGNDLESDLKERDFTINAISLSLTQPDKLLDPLGGRTDLFNNTLRACSSKAFINDPVRILRAIRLAARYELKILPETRSLMTKAVRLLVNVSPERLRDELFRILDGPKPAASILALDILGVLPLLLPELTPLKGVPQSEPHLREVWSHTLDTLKYLEILIQVIRLNLDEELSQGEDDNIASKIIFKNFQVNEELKLPLSLFKMHLSGFRDEIMSHLANELVSGRSLRSLIFFAALYHDAAKPDVQTLDDQGRIHFFLHDQVGSELIQKRGSSLRLSNVEIYRLKTNVKEHMRPTYLARLENCPTSRAIYCFFRDTGEAGIDICLLSLADLMATYGPAIPQNRWLRQLEVVGKLMSAWWENPEKYVKPSTLIRGNDLLVEFDLNPSPLIGRLLEMIREEQIEGNIETREEALFFVKTQLETWNENSL